MFLNDIETLMKNIHNFYSHSSKRQKSLKKVATATFELEKKEQQELHQKLRSLEQSLEEAIQEGNIRR